MSAGVSNCIKPTLLNTKEQICPQTAMMFNTLLPPVQRSSGKRTSNLNYIFYEMSSKACEDGGRQIHCG